MGELPNAPVPDPHVPQTEGLQIGDHRLIGEFFEGGLFDPGPVLGVRAEVGVGDGSIR